MHNRFLEKYESHRRCALCCPAGHHPCWFRHKSDAQIYYGGGAHEDGDGNIIYHCLAREAKGNEVLFGGLEESFNHAPRLLRKISITNPVTQFAMADEPIRLDDGSYNMENDTLSDYSGLLDSVSKVSDIVAPC